MCRNAITVVVRPQGRLEGAAARDLAATLAGLAQVAGAAVEVDLRGVPSLDEQAAAALGEAARSGRVCLTGMRTAARAQLQGWAGDGDRPRLRLAV